MRLASLNTGKPDGQLAVVSTDGTRFLIHPSWPTLQTVLEDWGRAQSDLLPLSERLSAGEGVALSADQLLAPLPRAWQWLDGSAFRSHGELMERLFGTEPKPPERPLMYQGMSHAFIGPYADVVLPTEAHGIDFEGEFGIIPDFVPMGTPADQAMKHIRLVVQINDWSLRNLAGVEMKTGFGWVQAKPACSVAPFAVTPDTLGEAWREGRVNLPLVVDWNGKRFGARFQIPTTATSVRPALPNSGPSRCWTRARFERVMSRLATLCAWKRSCQMADCCLAQSTSE